MKFIKEQMNLQQQIVYFKTKFVNVKKLKKVLLEHNKICKEGRRHLWLSSYGDPQSK